MVLRKIIGLLFLVTMVNSFSALAQPAMSKRVRKEISKHWESKNNQVLSVQKDKHLEVFSVFDEGKQLGWMVLAEAKGRYEYFDVLLIYSGKGILEHLKVLAYRSSYGMEITNPRWLRQFYGSSAAKKVKYKKDIDGLSGATFSAESLINMVNKGNARVLDLM
jgi:Na+-translocating ferredoxin:NAD+ oxidoreductase RnfG subunit